MQDASHGSKSNLMDAVISRHGDCYVTKFMIGIGYISCEITLYSTNSPVKELRFLNVTGVQVEEDGESIIDLCLPWFVFEIIDEQIGSSEWIFTIVTPHKQVHIVSAWPEILDLPLA